MLVNVCVQQGAWLIVIGKGLMHHVCHMVHLPQIFTLEASVKSITCRMQLTVSLFQAGNSVF